MTVFWMVIASACLLVCLGWLAVRTAASYGLPLSPWRFSAVLPTGIALTIVVISACRGSGSPAKSIVLICAAIAAATDLQTGYVFDRVLAWSCTALVVASALSGDIAHALVGAVAGAGLLALPWLCTRGRALGLGDVKLAGVLGFGLGVPSVFSALWFAAVSGGAVAAILLVLRRANGKTEIRFAPFLALGLGYAILEGWR